MLSSLQICHLDVFKTKLLNVHNIRVTEITSQSLTLSWDHTHSPVSIDPVEHFNIYLKNTSGTYTFVGRSFCESFHLPVTDTLSELHVFIQPVTTCRRKIAIEFSSSLEVNF